MQTKFLSIFVFLNLTLYSSLVYSEPLFLANNLQNAKKGDYIVTKRDKNFTTLYIKEASLDRILVEEITIPENRARSTNFNWKNWLQSGSPNHTSWVSYTIELPEGKIRNLYSQNQKCYLKINEQDNLFTTLLNLEFEEVPFAQRKRRGPSHFTTAQNVWQPKMISNGKLVPDVSFTPFRTQWPSDGTELAGKQILIYLPEDKATYPAYFPYWMQFSGGAGKVQLYIIDSGRGLSYQQ